MPGCSRLRFLSVAFQLSAACASDGVETADLADDLTPDGLAPVRNVGGGSLEAGGKAPRPHLYRYPLVMLNPARIAYGERASERHGAPPPSSQPEATC